MLPAVSCLGVTGGSPTHTQVCREVRVETTDVWRMTHGAGGKGRSPPTRGTSCPFATVTCLSPHPSRSSKAHGTPLCGCGLGMFLSGSSVEFPSEFSNLSRILVPFTPTPTPHPLPPKRRPLPEALSAVFFMSERQMGRRLTLVPGERGRLIGVL